MSQKYCPLLSPDLNKLRKSRDKLRKSAIKTKSRILIKLYRHVRNEVNLVNITLKKKYYSNKIQVSVGNLKKTWKVAYQILNKSSKTTKIDSIRLDDKAITDKKIIPNIMNEYFCIIGNSLKESIPYEKNPLMEGAYNINSTMVAKRVGTNSTISVFFLSFASPSPHTMLIYLEIGFNYLALGYDSSYPMSYLQNPTLFRGEGAIVFIYGVIY